MLAFATPPLGTPLPPATRAEPGPCGVPAPAAPLPFIRSVMPALDLAFGVEHGAAFPDAIAALTERLRAGPLGRAPRPGDATPPPESID